MKTGTYFLVASLMLLGGLLLTANPTLAAWADPSMPYNNQDSGSTSTSPGLCSDTSHMDDPTQLGSPVPVFKLCKANSGATQWYLEIKKDFAPFLLVCSWPMVNVADQSTFSSPSCTIPTTGYYRAIIWYGVNNDGTTPKSHIDRKFHR